LLVASNGTVNIGAVSTVTPTSVLAGYGFNTPAGSVIPTVGAALSTGTSSVVNVTPGAANATLTINTLDAAGTVNNSANLNVPANLNVAGLFTNNGVLNDSGGLGANQLAGGLANNGVLNGNGVGGLVIQSTKGNIQSKGALNLAAAGFLTVVGANVDLEGSVQIGGKSLSTTNQLTTLNLATTATPSQSGGVVDIRTSLFTSGVASVAGNAIRILSGGITTSAGPIFLNPGTKASAVADPFDKLSSLSYTFSMFPGTQVAATGAGGSIFVGNPGGDTSFSTSPGLNLDGQLSAQSITVFANNINSSTGLSGGFAVPNGGNIFLTVFGNVNNPKGAAANGSSSFLYNYVPVTVGANGTKAGTANIYLAGPSYSSATEQNVNLLVSGNVNLGDLNAGLTAPTLPTAAQSSYANNHLVVTATGNIGLNPNLGSAANTFYWPGLVYLTSGATASTPTTAPNTTASISLGTTTGANVSLNNLIPADLTTKSVGGQTGHGGVFLETNNLSLSPGAGTTGTVTISNNSWVNFLTSGLASAFQTTSSGRFFDAAISGNVVNQQKLPAADFQPK